MTYAVLAFKRINVSIYNELDLQCNPQSNHSRKIRARNECTLIKAFNERIE